MSLPIPDPVTQPFWDSLKAHAMKLQRCGSCQQFVFYPRAVCPACLSDDLVWTDASGRGVIHAFTIPYRQAPQPYVVVLVELEEGVRMLSNLVGVEPTPEAARIGTPVEIVYDDVSEAITLPKFRPSGSPPAPPR